MTLQLGPVIGKVGGAQLDEIPVSAQDPGNGTPTIFTFDPEGEDTIVVLDGELSYAGTQTSSYPNVSSTLRGNEPQATGNVTYAWVVSAPITISMVNNARLTAATFTGTVYVARL